MMSQAAGSPTVSDAVSSRTEALRILEIRRGLEREAARLAAERRSDADVEVLDRILATQLAAAEARDRAGFVRADAALHRAVAAATGNLVLVDLLEHLGAGLDDTIAVVVDEHQGTAEQFRAHVDLVDAIRGGHAEVAAIIADTMIAASIALVGVGVPAATSAHE